MYSNVDSPFREYDDAELIFLHVKDYKCLKDFDVDLSASYDACYVDNVLCVDKFESYVRKSEGLNLKLICGSNGVGKSSILELLRSPKRTKGNFLVFKCSDNVFFSTDKIDIKYQGKVLKCDIPHYEMNVGELSLAENDFGEPFLSFEKNITNFYVEKKELFASIEEDLFTHFKVDHWTSWGNFAEVKDDIQLKMNLSFISELHIEELRSKDLLTYLFYHHFGDSTFEEWCAAKHDEIMGIYKNKYEESGGNNELVDAVGFLIEVRKLFFDPELENSVVKLIDELGAFIGKDYSLNEFEAYSKKFYSVSNEYNTLMKSEFERNKVHLWEHKINDLFFFSPCKIFSDGKKRELNELSHGEYFSAKLRYKLFAKMLQGSCIIVLEDEPDRFLHPEWSRKFISIYIECFESVRDYLSKDKKGSRFYNVVMTSHSPLILSDFINEEVLYLRKIDGTVVAEENVPSCFAANIGEMLVDNFFLSKTIGAFAERQLREIVAILDKQCEERNVSSMEREKVEFVISKVGDRLLRKLLEDKYRRAFNETN